MNYWLFQVKPKRFQLRAALRADALKSFEVKSHKETIEKGDKVILWQTDPDGGCYALATVTSAVEEQSIPDEELPFFLENIETDLPRVSLQIDYNLWNRPITNALIPKEPPFDAFYGGLPGVNYRATSAQYEALIGLVQELDLALEPAIEYEIPNWNDPPLNLILYGPPGTGKTYQTVNHALSIIENRSLEELALEGRLALRRRFNAYQHEGQIAFVSFHPSFAYEDFVEGIKAKTSDGVVLYTVEDGIFKIICDDARKSLLDTISSTTVASGPSSEGAGDALPVDAVPLVSRRMLADCKKYVLIIDEINRANLPAVFGELISLLEADKRAGRPESLSTVLPYSKQAFGIPPNLYVIGTMNTADRTAEALDLALRRRFQFQYVPAQPQLLTQQAHDSIEGIDLSKMLAAINLRLEYLLGADYTIGHAYFFDVATFADLKGVFEKAILPLLEDYFFNDYAKIGLVLGSAFVVESRRSSVDDTVFSDFEHPYSDEFFGQKKYHIRPSAEWSAFCFTRIYES